jgi:phosphoribosylanthranilate isomerase
MPVMTVRAKICGLSDADSVHAAVAGGAAFVGFVFYPRSPRAITPDKAAELAALVPASVGRVGLFVDAGDDEIDAAVASDALDMLQLHGAESPARVSDLRARTGLRVMKAVSVAAARDVERAPAYYTAANWLMFDAKPPKDMSGALPGGNALAFDWLLLKGWDFPLPWMLAGGLDAGNVAEAVRLSGARFVDTSSGVEDSPGVKSPDRIREFLEAVAAL